MTGMGETKRSGGVPPVVVEAVLAFEAVPLSADGSRPAIVRWTDGSEGEALRWYDDGILVCEGDHGNSRLMSSRAERHTVAGSVRAWRAHNRDARLPSDARNSVASRCSLCEQSGAAGIDECGACVSAAIASTTAARRLLCS